jgi:hypothetical protein
MFMITYEKHDKYGNWTKHELQGFSDMWLAYKEAALLSVNNSNVAYIEIIEHSPTA